MTATETPGRVAQAEAYVRSRFYPPLPVEYGVLACEAVDACNAGTPDEEIDVSDLNPQPRAAYDDGDGNTVVTARDLVAVLRLEHLLAEECEPCGGHGYIEHPHPSDPSEAGLEEECPYCGGSGTL